MSNPFDDVSPVQQKTEEYEEIQVIEKKKEKNTITATIRDSDGKTFSRDWMNTANRLDVIRWTTEHGDAPYYVTVDKIIDVTITEN